MTVSYTHLFLYDGGYYLVPAVPYHAPQGCETQTTGTLYWHLYDWHYHCWLPVQCVSIHFDLI